MGPKNLIDEVMQVLIAPLCVGVFATCIGVLAGTMWALAVVLLTDKTAPPSMNGLWAIQLGTVAYFVLRSKDRLSQETPIGEYACGGAIIIGLLAGEALGYLAFQGQYPL